MSVGTWEEEAAVSSAGNLVDEKESAGMRIGSILYPGLNLVGGGFKLCFIFASEFISTGNKC